MSVFSSADRLPASGSTSTVAARSGSAIAVILRLPSRRSTRWLATTAVVSVSSGTVGLATGAATGSDLGSWLLVAAGVTAAGALLQAADLRRSA